MIGLLLAAALAPCTIHVPAVHAQTDGSGTETGVVSGSCSFAWHSVNEIEYHPDSTRRWHILGVDRHPGGAAGVFVRQPVDRDAYRGDGYWREVVKVYDATGTLRFRAVSPVSEFVA